MAKAKICVTVDEDTIKEAEKIFMAVGLTLNIAVNVFLKKSIQCGGLPFDVCMETPNAATIAALDESDALLANTKSKAYNSVKELRADFQK